MVLNVSCGVFDTSSMNEGQTEEPLQVPVFFFFGLCVDEYGDLNHMLMDMLVNS